MAVSKVFLWFEEEVVGPASERRLPYLTDVFSKSSKPKYGSVVLAIGFPAGDDQTERALSVLAVGKAGKPTGVTQGKVRIKLEPWTEVSPLTIETLNKKLADRKEREISVGRPSPYSATPLSPRQGEAVLRILSEFDPDLDAWLDRTWRTTPPLDSATAQVRAEVRDSVQLAAQLSGVEVLQSALVPEPDDPSVSDLMRTIVSKAHLFDLEEDLIPEELRRFDGDLKPKMASGSVAVFKNKNFQLSVFNVNKKPVEVHLGVDLIYWDLTHDVYTLLQYKRLERDSAGDWVYKREGEIEKQLALMPSTIPPIGTSTDWRMTQTPFWFKFVKGDAAKNQDGKLLRGMYIPADYMRLAITDGSLKTGPNGGFRVDYKNARYVTRDIFVELVKRGLVGTTSAWSEDLRSVVSDLTKNGRPVVLAVKSKWEKQEKESVDSLSAVRRDDAPF